MSTRLLILACLLTAALSFAAVTVHATPAPEGAESDCSWHENGTTIEIGQERYVCHCAELTGPSGTKVLCRWWNADKLPAAARRIKRGSKLHKNVIRLYPKPSVVA